MARASAPVVATSRWPCRLEYNEHARGQKMTQHIEQYGIVIDEAALKRSFVIGALRDNVTNIRRARLRIRLSVCFTAVISSHKVAALRWSYYHECSAVVEHSNTH